MELLVRAKTSACEFRVSFWLNSKFYNKRTHKNSSPETVNSGKCLPDCVVSSVSAHGKRHIFDQVSFLLIQGLRESRLEFGMLSVGMSRTHVTGKGILCDYYLLRSGLRLHSSTSIEDITCKHSQAGVFKTIPSPVVNSAFCLLLWRRL